MAHVRANPNPARISAPLWWLVQKCTDATATAFSAEYGGTWLRKGGSHHDAGDLKRTRPGDYSLRGVMQQTGPQQYGRAFDWTFPSAQRGDWSEIGVYSERVRKAWESNDPRMYGVFEVLCQTPEDRQPEGFVFYPERRFRIPDPSHEWHMHLGILTFYINDQRAMEALWSVLSGQTLAAWRTITGGAGVAFTKDQEAAIFEAAEIIRWNLKPWVGGAIHDEGARDEADKARDESMAGVLSTVLAELRELRADVASLRTEAK